MKRKIRSVLEEIDSIIPQKDKHLIVESRANHAIMSAINVLSLIKENFSEDEADDLTRRFLLAVKNHNPRKFEQGIKNIKESKGN